MLDRALVCWPSVLHVHVFNHHRSWMNVCLILGSNSSLSHSFDPHGISEHPILSLPSAATAMSDSAVDTIFFFLRIPWTPFSPRLPRIPSPPLKFNWSTSPTTSQLEPRVPGRPRPVRSHRSHRMGDPDCVRNESTFKNIDTTIAGRISPSKLSGIHKHSAGCCQPLLGIIRYSLFF